MSSTVLNVWARSRRWIALGLAGGAVVLSGCVVAPIDDGYADYGYTSTTVYTDYGYPPPPRVDYRTVAPSTTHIWVGGDWHWGGSRYDWRPGRWAPPGYRHVAPPSRPMFRPGERPRPSQGQPWQHRPQHPQMQPGHRPWPQARPDSGQRPPQARPDRGQRPSQARPDRGQRPPQARPDGGQRPSQARPDRGQRPPQQVRPNGSRPDNARPQPPQRRDGEGHRGFQRRDQGDERRGPRP